MSNNPDLAGLRALVVEDDAPIMHALTMRLKKEGLVAIPAPDGSTAIDIAAQVNPDVALLDINLPLKDGFEVAQALDSACGRAVPKVFVTALKDAATRKRALAVAAAVFLEKPFTTPYLLMRIREAIALGQTSAPAAG